VEKLQEEHIKQFAAAHNCIAGICDALPLEEERARLMAVQTPFVSSDIDKRIDPCCSLPGAQSVIALGKGYAPSTTDNLSSLGYGIDYHSTLTDILKELGQSLQCNYVTMVDSGPLAERAFAVKAGLGFWGRNGMVISPELGSFFNIGLLLVDITLTSSMTTHLTTQLLTCPHGCSRCIEACPIGAIKPYSIDAMACISHLTQKKGALTEDEVASISVGKQLYGCDLCQICCPMNKAFLSTSQLAKEDPADILAMDKADFDTRFGHTAMAWRGLKHLQRNAKIVMYQNGIKRG